MHKFQAKALQPERKWTERRGPRQFLLCSAHSRVSKITGDNNLSPLDFVSVSIAQLDNNYFKNLLSGHGLFTSDQELFTNGQGSTMQIVNANAHYEESFLIQYAA